MLTLVAVYVATSSIVHKGSIAGGRVSMLSLCAASEVDSCGYLMSVLCGNFSAGRSSRDSGHLKDAAHRVFKCAREDSTGDMGGHTRLISAAGAAATIDRARAFGDVTTVT